MTKKTALIAGATGLVGSCLLEQLLNDPNYSLIKSVTRSSSGITHPKLEEMIINFKDLDDIEGKLQADDVFCCLGTTMKKAGSKKKFREIDYDYPLKLAQASKARGARHYLLVTALGANRKSTFFYNKVKGELEDAVGNIGFDFFTILRPALILGERKEKRIVEKIGKLVITNLNFLLIGPFKKFRGVQAAQIAKKMLQAANAMNKKIRIIDSTEINS